MANKEKQKIDDWFDSYTPEQLKEKWEKYNYLSKPKKSIFFIRCCMTKRWIITKFNKYGIIRTNY